MSELDLTQWEAFAQKAYHLDKACLPIFAGALGQMALLTVGELREYPESTEANQPGRFNLRTHRAMGYYERGRGWWYPIFQEKTRNYIHNKRLGVIKAKKLFAPVIGYKLQRTSEQLSKRWAQEVRANEQAGFVEAVIGNNASYEQWVQGSQQTRKMAAIGWETADAAVEKLEPEYESVLSQAVDEIVAYFNKSGATNG